MAVLEHYRYDDVKEDSERELCVIKVADLDEHEEAEHGNRTTHRKQPQLLEGFSEVVLKVLQEQNGHRIADQIVQVVILVRVEFKVLEKQSQELKLKIEPVFAHADYQTRSYRNQGHRALQDPL